MHISLINIKCCTKIPQNNQAQYQTWSFGVGDVNAMLNPVAIVFHVSAQMLIFELTKQPTYN